MTLRVSAATLPPAPAPFVLIDDARPALSGAYGCGARGPTAGAGRTATLYRDPVEIVAAYRLADVSAALDRLRDAGARGLHVAGYMAYEAGFALEPALAGLATMPDDGQDNAPLMWFGLFDHAITLPADAVPGLLPAPGDCAVGQVGVGVSRDAHGRAVDAALALIRAGDIYQANISVPARVAITGDPLAAYAAIRPRAAMGHGAIVRHDGQHILSFSPELFFATDGSAITTRPMKGTAPRHADPVADADAAAHLAADEKQRAENLMIVDLMRNDLARVCRAGSIAVPRLFAVESYPTVHQMVSDVTGLMLPGLDAVDALAALFPCGSITGAPKIRAMEIIAAIEKRRRGVYTGSIGAIAADGSARFNVAIRTVSLASGAAMATLGLGSGIVADSAAANEWAECIDKARFLPGPAATGRM